MAAYVFKGAQDTPYPWGVVHPGDIAYFAHRAPNGDWSEVVTAPEPVAPPEHAADTEADVVEPTPDVPRRPNKAASKEDWQAYAIAEKSFTDATGIHPDDATRKEIVDHYTEPEGE